MDFPRDNLTRSVPFTLERAASGEGDGLTLEGYGAVFDTPTRIDSWEGTFDEVIARGAFARTLKARTPVVRSPRRSRSARRSSSSTTATTPSWGRCRSVRST